MVVPCVGGMPSETGLPGNVGHTACDGVADIHHAQQAVGGYSNGTYGREYESLHGGFGFVCPVATPVIGSGKPTGYTYRHGYGKPHEERYFPSCDGKSLERA